MNIVPHIVVDGGSKAIDYYTAAFGATVVRKMPAPDGQRLMHAELKVGESTLMLCDDFPEYNHGNNRAASKLPATPVTLHLNVPDCDAAMAKAAAAGGTITMPASDMFWGDRYGQVKDPFGHLWSFSHPLPCGPKA